MKQVVRIYKLIPTMMPYAIEAHNHQDLLTVLEQILVQILEQTSLSILMVVHGIKRTKITMGFLTEMMPARVLQSRMVLLMDVRVGKEIRMMMGSQMQLMNVLKLPRMNSPIKLDVQIAKVKEVWLQMEMIHQ